MGMEFMWTPEMKRAAALKAVQDAQAKTQGLVAAQDAQVNGQAPSMTGKGYQAQVKMNDALAQPNKQGDANAAEADMIKNQMGFNVTHPYAKQGDFLSQFYADPNIAQQVGQYTQGMDETERQTADMRRRYEALASGKGPSYANQAGRAQMNQARAQIQQQALGASRGGMSSGNARAAIMGASGVQGNMAGQIAANRAKERMDATQGMMQATQLSGMNAEARRKAMEAMAKNYGGAAEQSSMDAQIPIAASETSGFDSWFK